MLVGCCVSIAAPRSTGGSSPTRNSSRSSTPGRRSRLVLLILLPRHLGGHLGDRFPVELDRREVGVGGIRVCVEAFGGTNEAGEEVLGSIDERGLLSPVAELETAARAVREVGGGDPEPPWCKP